MLRKHLLSLVFVLMFALVQAGIVTHEISHFQNLTHSQQDKNTTTEHCAQCVIMAHADGALAVSGLKIQATPTLPHWSVTRGQVFLSNHSSVYAARAPPLFIHA